IVSYFDWGTDISSYGPIAWAPDGEAFVTTGPDPGIVHGWDAETMKPTGTLDLGKGLEVSALTSAPAADAVLATVETGEVWLLDPSTMKTVGEPYLASGTQLQRSAMSPDGELVASLNRTGSLRLWAGDGVPLGPALSATKELDGFEPDPILRFTS